MSFKKIKFDKSFGGGTATSGPQSEGSKDKPQKSIMDHGYEINKDDFHDQIGPTITTNTYENYKSDIDIMDSLKLNSFRTSIQGTRLIKNLSTNEVDKRAVSFYRDYFQRLKDKKIKLIVNLFHFDMPIELENIGGWSNKEVVESFVQYAKICFENFGDLVDYGSTFNEPVVPIEGCYLYKGYYPKIVDFKKGIQAGYNTILAHAKTVNLFHEMFVNNKNKKISVILNLTPTYPKDNESKNIKAAELRDELFNKSFINSMVNGVFSQKLINFLKNNNLLPEYTKDELLIIKKSSIDFLGVNYYQPSRIQAPLEEGDETRPVMPEKGFINYEGPDRRINPYRGGEIHPETLYKIGLLIKNEYKNIPGIVSENGLGVENEKRFMDKSGVIKDDYRIEFIKEHLYGLNKSIQEGSNCFGYQLGTFIDCGSGANAYKNRYGIVSLDLETQKRTIKKSGHGFKEIIENQNEIEINLNILK